MSINRELYIDNLKPEMISGCPLGVSIYSVREEYFYYHSRHLEIIFCLKGNAVLTVSHEVTMLYEGDIYSCDPLDVHFLSSSEDNLIASFYIDLTSPLFDIPDLIYFFFVCQSNLAVSGNQSDKIKRLKAMLLTVLYCYGHNDAGSDGGTIFSKLAKNIIDLMIEDFPIFYFINKPYEYSLQAKERFKRIMVYINKHYMEKITVEILSEIEHLNTNYLSRFFKETSFIGLSRYVNYIRVYNSELLLFSTRKSISEIAYDVGFSDPKFYYKNFKYWYKRTPLQHKKHHQRLMERAAGCVYFRFDEMLPEMEHYIAGYFTQLNLPN